MYESLISKVEVIVTDIDKNAQKCGKYGKVSPQIKIVIQINGM